MAALGDHDVNAWQDGTRPKSREGLAERIIDGEALIVNAEGGEILVLNAAGAFVWQLLDGAQDVASIALQVEREFDVEPATARRDLEEFLSHLAERGALD